MAALLADLEPGLIPEKVSWERFLEISEGTDLEWVDGHVVGGEVLRTVHSRLVAWLNALLYTLGEARGHGFVFTETMLLRLNKSGRSRCPDVSFLLRENEGRLKTEYIEGPVDLAIEVISPNSLRRDYVEKRDEYEREGVTEYWILDPEHGEATFLRLDASGRYVEIELDEEGRISSSVVPGLQLFPSDIWAEPKPSPTQYLLAADV